MHKENVFELTLNGEVVRWEGVSPNTTLLDLLRQAGRTGSKEGCAEGDCGACSVVVLSKNTVGASCWRSFNSCITPAVMLHGAQVMTVEGVAGAGCGRIAGAIMDNFGSQCGYCTPGIVMSMVEAATRRDITTEDQVADQLCGNLCRCTGYRAIRQAAAELLAEGGVAVPPEAEAPAPVEYAADGRKFYRPLELAALFQTIAQNPDGRLVAGATEVGLEITKRNLRFDVIIALDAVAELKRWEETELAWKLGAGLTLVEVEEVLGGRSELSEMLRWFGSRQIRNRATLGGNLATASPIGDTAPVLLAVGATLGLVSAKGRREVDIAGFFVGYRKTGLQPGELIEWIALPKPQVPEGGKRYANVFKVSRRKEMDISTVSLAAEVLLDGENKVTAARIAYGGVAATPVRSREAEAALIGNVWSEDLLRKAAEVAASTLQPISDTRGSAEYRKALIRNLLIRFFHEPQWVPCTKPLSAPGERPISGSPHESAHLHANGAALYTDDVAQRRRVLEVWPVTSPHAHARILLIDDTAARSMHGVVDVLMAGDIPGANNTGPSRPDEPLFAVDEVHFHGQIVALVVGHSLDECRLAAEAMKVVWEPLPALLSIEAGREAQSFLTEPHQIRRGEPEAALKSAKHRLTGTLAIGGQDHFYLEMHAAFAEPGDDGGMRITCSTQHPSEVQHMVAKVLALPDAQVVVQCPRMGGGFGGKETQASIPASLASLAAKRTGQPVRACFNRDQDMVITGKRHPFFAEFEVGFADDGALEGLDVSLWSDGGWSLDLSMPVMDRAMFHLDNAYYLPAVEVRGQVVRTNLPSNTAFRGFGGPQGMAVIEEIMDRIARHLGLPPEQVRERNLYRAEHATHYGQPIGDERLLRIWSELMVSSDFAERRKALGQWNGGSPTKKRGMAITPVKFGISFTLTHYNQAGALVLVYQDGSVQVNHGGLEMGQGIHTNMRLIAAQELDIDPALIRVMPTSTDKVPNTSATAASSGTDLNGAAVQAACVTLRERLVPVAALVLGCEPGEVDWGNSGARCGDKVASWGEIVRRAYTERVSLSTTGYFRTPEIHWDRATGKGIPFRYFAVGAAVAEVEIDGLTGGLEVRRVDILHDVGTSIHEGINLGQIEGGFVQGMGWLTCEELVWDAQGRLLTHSPDTYKIPAISDAPKDFRVSFLKDAANPKAIFGTKAVGEPPLMLAFCVREAIKDAVSAFGTSDGAVKLKCPATGEAILRAIGF